MCVRNNFDAIMQLLQMEVDITADLYRETAIHKQTNIPCNCIELKFPRTPPHSQHLYMLSN